MGQPEHELPGAGDAVDDPDQLPLIAFSTSRRHEVPIEPSPRQRDWMHGTDEAFAYRCLPLVVANESGWLMRNPIGFSATWSGEDGRSATTLEFDEEIHPPRPIQSHFGYGIVTWSVPFLFRTPPGYNLLARGPANSPKDGASALEGLVEADWSIATFTMNWKLTRPGLAVRFDRGEPFCMVVPQKRGELERFVPEIRQIETEPETRDEVEQWSRSRDKLYINKFLATYSNDFAQYRKEWDRDYTRGRTPGGELAREHQTRIRLRPFTTPDDGS
jgi:hypothetical protein